MRKKLTALAMTAALIVGSAFSGFAATSPTTVTVTSDTVTVTDSTGAEVEVYDSEDAALEALEAAAAEAEAAGEEFSGAVLVVSETTETVETSDEEVASVVEDALAALLEDGSDAAYNQETGEALTAEEAVVIGTAEFAVVSYNGGDINWPVTIDFQAPGVTAKNFIALMHKPEEGTNAGKWVDQNGSVPSDGVVRGTFENLSPVAFVINSTVAEDDGTSSSDGDSSSSTGDSSTGSNTSGSSSQTGDISIAVPVALLVVAGVAIVVLVMKGRKKEAE